MAKRRKTKDRMPTPQAARYCVLSPSYLEKARVAGTGPAFLKLGRRVVYDVRDLDAWLESRRRTSTSDPGGSSAPLTRPRAKRCR